MQVVLVADADDTRREALAEALRTAGNAVAAIGHPDALPAHLRPDVLVVSERMQLVTRRALLGRLGAVTEVVDTGDTAAVLAQVGRASRALVTLSAVTVDLLTRGVLRDGASRKLTEREAALLAWFVSRAGEVVTRSELLVHVWGYRPDMVTRTVDITVGRLRDKIEADPRKPEHLLTVRGEGYRFVLPEVAPPPVEALLGRGPALAELRDELASGRVVTIVGPGGVGKTTLARVLADAEPRSTWVSLESSREGEVATTVARAVDLADPAALSDVLRYRDGGLLVLDNVEHVARETAELVQTLLAEVPGLRILATGRVRLRTRLERVFALEPLGPDDAATLLRTRAAERAPGWGDEDAAVHAIVARLDGLPLALELAAARARLLEPAALARRLEASPGWLHAPEVRDETLLQTVAWSWDLLEPATQHALAMLSVFRGPFSTDAAEAVLGPGALLQLDALLDHALLHSRDGLLRPYVGVAAFARRQLADPDAAAEAHLSWAARFATNADARVYGPEGWQALEALVRHRPDLLAALEHAVARQDPRAGALARGLLHDWEIRSAPAHEVALVARAPRVPGVQVALAWARLHQGRVDEAAAVVADGAPRPWLDFARGLVAERQTDLDAAEAAFRRCLDGPGPVGLRAPLELSTVARRRRDLSAAMAWLEEAQRRAERLGSEPFVVTVRGVMANLAQAQARYALSLTHLRAVLAVHRQRGHEATVGIFTGMVGIALYKSGRAEEALEPLADCLARCRRWGNAMLEGMTRSHRCRALLHLARFDAALDDALEAAHLARASGGSLNEVVALRNAAWCWLELGEWTEAEATLDQVDALVATHGLHGRRAELSALRGWLALHAGTDLPDLGDSPAERVVRGVAERRWELVASAVADTPEQRDTSDLGERSTWLALLRRLAGEDPSEALAVAERALAPGWRPEATALLATVRSGLAGTPTAGRWASSRLAAALCNSERFRL